jgi:quinol monooxygenase YgiN
MPTTIVRYELDPASLDEHLTLIDGVFSHLAETAPSGVSYEVFRATEGMDFTHIASFDDAAAQEAFSTSPAFKAFAEAIGDRCIVPPSPAPQIEVHSHGS